MVGRATGVVFAFRSLILNIRHRFKWMVCSFSQSGQLRRTVALLILVLILPGCVTNQNAAWGSKGSISSSPYAAEHLLAVTRKADTAYKSSQWSDAADLYRVLLEKLPEDPYVWFRLGNSLTHQGHYQQAIYAFETSLAKDAGQSKPWFNLSTTYLLGAQLASMRAMESLAFDDPARNVMQHRLIALAALLP